MDVYSPNDLCPCGSGKKLIDCCGAGEFGKLILGTPKYDETVILKELLENSVLFNTFYSKERHKIKTFIIWSPQKKNLPLPPGILGNNSILPQSGLSIITLKNFPPCQRDAYIVAHEIEHVIQHFEGLPALMYRDDLNTIPRGIKSIIPDILDDEKLISYGFDVTGSYLKEYNHARINISSKREQNLDENLRKIYLFNYVDALLSYHRFFNSNSLEPPLFSIFNKRYPTITKEANEIVKFIETHGYETPQKLRDLYTVILKKYGFENCAFIL